MNSLIDLVLGFTELLLIIVNLVWFIAGPVIWIIIFLKGIETFKLTKVNGGKFSSKASPRIVKAFIITLILIGLGFAYAWLASIYSINRSPNNIIDISSFGIAAVADIFTLYLLKLYLGEINSMSRAIEPDSINEQQIPRIAFVSTIILTLVAQVIMTIYVINPAVSVFTGPLG